MKNGEKGNRDMKLLIQIGLVLGVYWAAQLLEMLLPFAFPASVIGIILLLILLLTKAMKVEHIQDVSDFLLGNLQFFFIPVTVSLLNYMDLILENSVAFLTICVVSTILTFTVTAWVVTMTIRLMERRKK